MQPSRRREHSAEFKAAVLAECEQPGASVAAVAQSRGLNVNLVRKWLVGRGLKRAGLAAPRTVTRRQPSEVMAGMPPLQFVPFELAGAGADKAVDIASGPSAEPSPNLESNIHVELRRGSAHLTVRWPSSQADACAAWLRELAGTVK
ncbi:transposase [Variovorax paradoxus]|uniref:transposase n=1 Tax=Variovorax paradoxus TaxID=34073 RepID=UPI001ABD1B89